MKKNYKDIILIVIIIVLGIYISLNLFKSDNVIFIEGSDELYQVGVNYLIENDNNPFKNKEHYKMFVDYHGFGVAKDDKYKYLYMWIVTSSNYIKNKEIVEASGNSMPYKFILSKDNKVIKYMVPEDGHGYEQSIIRLFPRSINKKLIKYKASDKIDKEIEEYYKDILNKE